MTEESFCVIANDHQLARKHLREYQINPDLPEIFICRDSRSLRGRRGAFHIFEPRTSLPIYIQDEMMDMVRTGHFRGWTEDDFSYLRGITALGIHPTFGDLISGSIDASKIIAGTITSAHISSTMVTKNRSQMGSQRRGSGLTGRTAGGG